MPFAKPALQLGFYVGSIVIGAWRLVRGAPPGGAAASNRHKAHAQTLPKRLRQPFRGWIIADAAPA
jgi:hypothetical protein